MKKSYIYFVVPMVALAAFFFGLYWNAHAEYQAREQGKVKAARDARQSKLEKEAKDREKAVAAALESQEKRKAEKKIRDEREAIA